MQSAVFTLLIKCLRVTLRHYQKMLFSSKTDTSRSWKQAEMANRHVEP